MADNWPQRLTRGIGRELTAGTVTALPGLYALGGGVSGAVRDIGDEGSQGFGKDMLLNMQYPRRVLERMRTDPVMARAVQVYYDELDGGSVDDAENIRQYIIEKTGHDPRGRKSMQFVEAVDTWSKGAFGLEDQTPTEELAAIGATAFIPMSLPSKAASLSRLISKAPRAAQLPMNAALRVGEVALPGSTPYTPLNIGANAAFPVAITEGLNYAADEPSIVRQTIEAADEAIEEAIGPIMQPSRALQFPDMVTRVPEISGLGSWFVDKGDE